MFGRLFDPFWALVGAFLGGISGTCLGAYIIYVALLFGAFLALIWYLPGRLFLPLGAYFCPVGVYLVLYFALSPPHHFLMSP